TTYDNVDPADHSAVWGKVPECGSDEVGAAVEAAAKAFASWRFSTGDFRTKAFYRLTGMLKESEDGFVGLMTREMGKTRFDSRLDFIEAVGVCEAISPQGASLKGVTYQKLTPGLSMESRLAPRGVAAIITPFNFPLAIPVAQIMSAIIAGCTVVWKPSHLVPECAQAICALIECALAQEAEAAGLELPTGILNMVHGDAETGAALICQSAVQTISFTGSKKVGDQVDAIASGLGKRVMKEVAGINFFYVHEAADIERAARNFVYGKTITSGQRCSSIQEALVDSKVAPEFTARVLELAPGGVHGPGGSEEITAADTDADSWSCPPLVSEEQRDRLAALVESSIEHGAELLYQAQLPDGLQQNGNYFPFTLLTGVDENNPLYSQEAFGPAGV
ncbi:MAG: aldehyde dehydrogenase family protein, partial [Planctomycetes bacterium]|nr:aldehyde dehydrogenase family protein [Planctomycetota bacterium]